ncbi:MAG: carboxypeptidase regulatory-like domain-containing protein [Kofleriaceae bacterium]
MRPAPRSRSSESAGRTGRSRCACARRTIRLMSDGCGRRRGACTGRPCSGRSSRRSSAVRPARALRAPPPSKRSPDRSWCTPVGRSSPTMHPRFAPAPPACAPGCGRTRSRTPWTTRSSHETARTRCEVDFRFMYRLVGRVEDAEGHAVAGASVWIESNAVTSDRHGGFAIENLVGRSYEVRAQAGDLIGGSRVIRLTEDSEPLVIELSEGRHVIVTVVDASRAPIANASLHVIGSDHVVATDASGTARITTHPREGELEVSAAGYARRRVSDVDTVVLREGFAVSGRVVDEPGAPIANARVCAWSSMGLEQATAITDRTGAFTIPSIVGIHHLLVTDGEHAPTRLGPIDVDRVIADLEIAMKPGGVYAGRVVDTDGRPVARARVCLDTLTPSSRRFSASSDANGAFEIRGLPRTLGITGGDDEVAVVYAASEDAVSDDVIVESSGGQVLTIRRIDTAGVIAGVVVDDTGVPVANIVVNAVARERLPLPEGLLRAKAMQDHPAIATSTRANARGEFSIRDLPVGEYGIWAGAFFPYPYSGLPTLFAAGIDVSPDITSVTTGNTDVHLVMPRPGRIIGTVAYADTGELVDDFEVDLFGRYEIATSQPGEHGAFDLRDVKPGSYGVCIRRGLLAAPRVNVQIDAGASCDLGTITIERGRTLTGTVVDSTGRTIAGASVMVRDHGLFDNVGRFDATLDPSCAVTDATGAFAIAEVPTHSSGIVVGAAHPSYGRSLASAAAQGSLTLTLLECGSIAGTLTRDTQPLRGSVSAAWPALALATTNEDGAFAMPRLPAGPVTLRVQVFGDHSEGVHETMVVVEAGRQTSVAIEVPAGTVKLAVVMTPEPAGASLYLFRGTIAFESYPELLAQFVAGIHGRADWTGDAVPTFERLVPGDYTVCVMPLAGNPHDPQLMRQVYNDRASVKVYSTPVRVVAAPAEQMVTVKLAR